MAPPQAVSARILLNLALAALVAALALAVYFQRPAARQPEFRLASIAPAEITRILIEKPGQPAIALEKSGGRWRLTRPFLARTSTPQVERLLDILTATSNERLPATELSRFELDRPLLRLTLNGQEFAFGTRHPLGNEQYVSTLGQIYLLPPRYFAAAAKPPTDFASPRLFADDETPAGFELPGFSALQNDGKWTLTPPNHDLTPDRLNQWANEWRLATALLSQPHSGAPLRERIRVRLAGGKTIPLAILQREPELVLLREDEGMQFHFPAETARRLLDLKANSSHE